MSSSRSLILATSLILVACTPMQWVKPGADAAMLSEDTAQCQRQAQREAWLHAPIFQPMVPIILRDAQGRSFVTWRRPFAYDSLGDQFREEQRLMDFCLRAKGYNLVPLPEVKGEAAQQRAE